jgi:glycosyltransferase involved in cell wall biosynthesis
MSVNVNKPEISVVMGVYNAAPYLREAIESILNQTFTNFEFIIINDGSTDESAEIIKSYKDSRLVIIEQENRGLTKSLNIGLKNARADYIARIDADDIALPDRFQLQYDFLESNPDFFIVGGAYEVINEKGEYIYTNYPPVTWEEILQRRPSFPIAHPTVLYRKKIIIENGGYDERYWKLPSEDFLLWNRIVNTTDYKIANVDKPIIKYRLTFGSLTDSATKSNKILSGLIRRIISGGSVSEEEIKEYVKFKEQQSPKKKKVLYNLNIAKKFLVMNYKPEMARKYSINAMKLYPFSPKPYFLFFLSILPQSLLNKIYKKRKKAQIIAKTKI